ncbi:MAG: tRNA pseudouridine(38-40) synthase TruA [Acidimicrobiia bacterium]|nr:tRNA pseudouridine(38-40) synthase TruA [Acidimicrobiia bacterium]
MRTLKLTIAYDGTHYAGWQRQANAVTIQQVLEDEIAAMVGGRSPLNAAGRTDAGVHAAAQVASISIDHDISCDDLLRALNARLKAGDIRVRSIEEMPDRWDARVFAKSKTYRYAIWNGVPPNPFIRHVVWHVPYPLELERMRQAAAMLVGEHDFAAFKGRGTDVLTTRRAVLSAEIAEVEIHTDQPVALSPLGSAPENPGGRLLRFDISGTGFLRHMVRTIAGTLVDIGRGNMEAGDMRAILETGERARTGQTAPAQGLMLWQVSY